MPAGFAYNVFFSGQQNDVAADTRAAIKLVVEAALTEWGRYIGGLGTLDVELRIGITPNGTGRFGGGYERGVVVETTGGRTIVGPPALAELRSGVDANGSAAEIIVFIEPGANLDRMWWDPTPSYAEEVVPGQSTDGLSVALHEIAHALGIIGYINPRLDLQTLNLTTLSTFDRLVARNAAGNLEFTGANARAVYGGNVPLLTRPGTNLDEYSQNVYHMGATTNPMTGSPEVREGVGADGLLYDLMNGATFYFGERYNIGRLDLAILQDLGYEVTIPDEMVMVNLRDGAMPGASATSADDIISGTAWNERIQGLSGNDVIHAYSGNDYIEGGDGNDAIDGGGGHDVVFGGSGNDVLKGGIGVDSIDGGTGSDTALFTIGRAGYYVRSFVSGGQFYTQVTAASGTDGVDTLVNVETLGFNNGAQAFGIAGIQQNLVSNMRGSYYDDVLFQNSSTGQIIYQSMNAGTAAGFGSVLGSLPTGWKLIGSDDFTGDGRADALVQNTNTGAIYTLNIASGSVVWGTVSAGLTSSFQAIASGDVTRDGTADVLVRDNGTGQLYIADMDAGGTFGGWIGGIPNLGTGYRTVGLGDFNRDGASDILVQNVANGTTYYRDMVNGTWGLVSGAVGSQWVAREAADLNGDGYADVVFRNTSTGDIWWVNMLGGSNAGWGVVATGLTGWDVRGSADVDNDGYRDVLIQNTTNGTTYYADMNAGTFAGWGTVSGQLGTQWLAVA